MMSKHNTKVTEMTEDSNLKDLIIKTFPNITDLNSVDKNGETLFHHACRENEVELAGYLIDNGVDPDIESNENRKAWHYLVYNAGNKTNFKKASCAVKRRRLMLRLLDKIFMSWQEFENGIFEIVADETNCKNENGQLMNLASLNQKLYAKDINLLLIYKSLLYQALEDGHRRLFELFFKDDTSQLHFLRFQQYSTICVLKLLKNCNFAVVRKSMHPSSPVGFIKVAKEILVNIPTSEWLVCDWVIDELVSATFGSVNKHNCLYHAQLMSFVLANAADQDGDQVINPDRSFQRNGIKAFVKLNLHGHVDKVAKLLEYHGFCNRYKVFGRRIQLFNPLCAAALCGDDALLRCLIENGGDIEAIDLDSCFPPMFFRLFHFMSVSSNGKVTHDKTEVKYEKKHTKESASTLDINHEYCEVSVGIDSHAKDAEDKRQLENFGKILYLHADATRTHCRSTKIVKFLSNDMVFKHTTSGNTKHRNFDAELLQFNKYSTRKLLNLMPSALELLRYVIDRGLRFTCSIEDIRTPPKLLDYLQSASTSTSAILYILFQAGASIHYIVSEFREVWVAGYSTDFCKAVILENRTDILFDDRAEVASLSGVPGWMPVLHKRVKEDFFEWHRRVKKSPFSLRCQCRTAIRRHLVSVSSKRSILPKVDLLPLPNLLKKYLIYEGGISEVNLNEARADEDTSPTLDFYGWDVLGRLAYAGYPGLSFSISRNRR